MALILGPKEEGWGESYGKALGQLGEGFGSGFQALANMKMQDYATRQAQTRQNEQAQKVSDMMKAQYGDKFAQIPFMPQHMQGPAFKYLQEQQSAPIYAQAVQQLMNKGQQEQQPGFAQRFNNFGQQSQPNYLDAVMSSNQPPSQPDIDYSKMSRRDLEKFIPMAIQTNQFEEKMANERKKFAESKLRADRKEELHDKEYFNKEAMPKYNEIIDRAEQSDETRSALNKMEQLNNSGQLPSAGWAQFVQSLAGTSIGKFMNINSLLGVESEEYNKLSTEMFRGATKAFGGKVAVQEFQNWLKRIPTLTNTPEGRAEIIRDLKIWDDIYNARADVARQIKAENNGYLPHNFDDQLKNRSTKKVNELKKQYMQSVNSKPFSIGQRYKSPNDMVDVPEGAKTRNRKTGQILVRRNGKWTPE